MPTLLRTLVVSVPALAALAGLLAAPAASAADTRIFAGNQDNALRALEAYGGTVAWFTGERYDPSSGRERLRLYVRRNGVTRMAPWTTSVPEDINLDLGPAKGGGVVAVYTRCSEGVDDDTIFDTVDDTCDVHRVDTATLESRPVRGVNTRSDERSPAFWRDLLVFGRRGRGGGGGVFASNPLHRLFKSGRLRQADLVGGTLAYLTIGYAPDKDDIGERVKFRRFNRRTAGRACELGRTVGEQGLTSPSLTRRHVYWLARSTVDADTSRAVVLRRALPARRCRQRGRVRRGRSFDTDAVTFIAVDGARLYYVRDNSVFESFSTGFG